MCIKTIALCAVGGLMLMVSSALAETSTTICWGEFRTSQECKQKEATNDCSHTCSMNRYTTFYPCGSGGYRGFKVTYACQAVCGKPVSQGCTIKSGPSTDGNNCGYSWPTVVCD